MMLEINAEGQLKVNDSVCTPSGLRSQIVAFVGQESKRTTHILQVKTDPKSHYDAYFKMQNEIVAAYAQLREQRARTVYHKAYVHCTNEQREALQQYYPQRVAEEYDEN